MKAASQPFQLQKKLIIHIDVNNVLKITSSSKDLFVSNHLHRCMIYVRTGYGGNYKKIIKKIHKK